MSILSGVTISIGSNATVTYNSHGLANGQIVFFTTTGALPTGLTVNYAYYVAGVTDNTFNLTNWPGNANITTSGSQSGTHTLYTQNVLASPKTPFNMSDSNIWYKCNFSFVNGYSSVRRHPGWYTTGYDALGNGVSMFMKFFWDANITDMVWPYANLNNFYVDRDITFFISEKLGTTTISIANPAVITYNSHPFDTGDGCQFTTTGALPSGITKVTAGGGANIFWVGKIDNNTFWLYKTKAEALLLGSSGRISTSGTQSGTHTLWKVQRTNNVQVSDLYPSGPKHYTGWWIKNIALSSPLAVTAAGEYIVGAWYGQGTSTGTFSLQTTADLSTPTYIPCCAAVTDQTTTFQSGQDFQIIRAKMTVDASYTAKDLQSYASQYFFSYCGWVVPSGSYTFGNTTMVYVPPTVGPISINAYSGYYFSPGSGFQIGDANTPQPLDKKVTILAKTPTQGPSTNTTYPGFMRTGATAGATITGSQCTGDVYMYGTHTANRTATLASPVNAYFGCTCLTGTPGKISITATWAGEGVWFSISGTVVPGGLSIGTLYQMKNKSGSNYDIYDKAGNPVTVSSSGTSPLASPVFELTDSVDWDIGDKISFGPEPFAGPGTTATYAIGDMSADKKRFCIGYAGTTQYFPRNAAVPAGGFIINGTKYSIELDSEIETGMFCPGNHFYMDKVSIHRAVVYNPTVSYLDPAAMSRYEIKNCVGYGTSSGRYVFTGGTLIPASGIYIYNMLVHYINLFNNIVGNTVTVEGVKRSSGTITIDTMTSLRGTMINYATTNPLGLAVKWIVSNVFIYNNTYTFMRSGIGSTFTNFRIYGSSCNNSSVDTYGAICYKNAINCTATGDYLDYIVSTYPYYTFNNGSPVVNTTIASPMFDTLYPTTPTNHVGFSDACYLSNVKMTNPNKNIVVDTSLQQNIIDGSAFTVLNWNSVANDDRNYYKYGMMVRTGTALGDTTAHSSSFAMRFQPNSGDNSLRYSKDIPIGAVPNKDMAVLVWCKINSANYYAGTYQMPRLEISYDDGTVKYAEAAKTTDWQVLYIPFTPSTSVAQITATFDVRSDATGSDAYVYFDDFSTLFPAGTTLSLGSFDLWANGEPITPYISTNIAAADVWAINSTSFADGSIGKVVTNIKNDTGLIPALL